MEWKAALREIADKTSDLILVAALFGLQAAIATRQAQDWIS